MALHSNASSRTRMRCRWRTVKTLSQLASICFLTSVGYENPSVHVHSLAAQPSRFSSSLNPRKPRSTTINDHGFMSTRLFSFNGGMPYSASSPPPPRDSSFSTTRGPGNKSDDGSSSIGSNVNNVRNTLVLYGHPGSRSPLINWAALELGLELDMGDLANNPHPFGKIPCLTDRQGEIGLFESGAILQYLQDQYGAQKQQSRLSPGQSAALASWIVWANASLEPICFLPSDDGKIQDTGLRLRKSGRLKDIDRLDEILENLSRQQQRMPPGVGGTTDVLSGGRSSSGGWNGAYPPASPSTQSAFLLGKEFTLADVAVASYLLFALRFFPDTDLSRWPNIVKYLYTCASRKTYAMAFGKDIQESLMDLLRGMSGGRELASSSLVLYGHPSSTSPAINWAGYEFGLELVMGNPAENPHPYRKIPCLTDQNGKIMVFENSAILQYLQDHYESKKAGSRGSNRNVEIHNERRKPPSSTSDESAQISSWIEWAGTTLEPICLVDGMRNTKRKPLPERQIISQKPKPLQRSIPISAKLPRDAQTVGFYDRPGVDFQALDELNHILAQRQRQLEQRQQEPERTSEDRFVRDVPPSSCFLVGDEFSLADVAISSLLLFIPQNFPGTDLSQWPYLIRYMKANALRPGFARAFGPDVQAYLLEELGGRTRGAGPPQRQPPLGSNRLGLGPDDDEDRRRNGGNRLFTPAYRS